MNIVSTQDILKDFLKSREFDNYSTYLTIKSCIKKWGKKLPISCGIFLQFLLLFQ